MSLRIRALLAVGSVGVALAACAPLLKQPAPAAEQEDVADEEDGGSPEFKQTKADLDAAIAAATQGYAPGDTLSGRLDAFTPLEFPVVRLTCYVGVLVLAEGAAFGPHARKSTSVISKLPGEVQVNHAGAIHGPGAVFELGCPPEAGTASVDLIANWGAASDQSRVHELGSGGYTLQLYVKNVSEQELAERRAREKAAAERQAQESQEFQEQQRLADERREQQNDEQRAGSRPSPDKGAGAAAAGPAVVSVSLRSRCSKTVKVFYGKEPKFGSGTTSTLGGNSVQSHSFKPGDMMWLLDDSGNGVASVTASQGMREIEVNSACSGLTSR